MKSIIPYQKTEKTASKKTKNRAKTRLGIYDNYQEPLLEEQVTGKLQNHIVYTPILSAVKLLTKLQNTTLWDGLINSARPIQNLPQAAVRLNTISTSYPAG